MPRHRQPTPVARRARPALVAAGTLTLVTAVAGVALASTTPGARATVTPSARTTAAAITPSSTGTPSNSPSTSTTTQAPAAQVATSTPSSSAGTHLSGASGDGAADGTLGQWRGKPVDIVGTWADVGDNQTQLWSIAPGGEVADFDGAIDIAPGGLLDGDTWAAAATGAYDARWRESLTRMAELRQGRGTTYVRPFHEFNLGGAYPWQVTPDQADDFTAAWKRYRAIQQQVFPQAKLVYGVNVTSSGTGLDWRTTWPGAGQADVLGVDSYNGWPTISTKAEFDAQLDARGDDGVPVGLNAYAEQAEQWGVPLAVPEWSGRAQKGDESAYVTGMVDWFAAHAGNGPGHLAYEILFNAPMDDGNFQLFADDTKMPASAAAYVAAVKATDGGSAPTATPSDIDSNVDSAASPAAAAAPTSPTTATATTTPSAAASVDPEGEDQADGVRQVDVDELLARVDALLARLEQR